MKNVFSAPIHWSAGNQGVTSKAFAVLIDGINTTVTISTATGTLFAGFSDGGGTSNPTNLGTQVSSEPGAIAGIESRTSEALTIRRAQDSGLLAGNRTFPPVSSMTLFRVKSRASLRKK